MKTLKARKTSHEGWAVHIYNGDRHLLCTLEPSHSWVFVIGISVGMVAAFLLSSLNSLAYMRRAASTEAVGNATLTDPPATSIQPSDSQQEPVSDSIFLID